MTDRRQRMVEDAARDARRLAQRKPAGLAGLLVIGGTVGLLVIVPTLLGAYGGRWLDTLAAGYSVRWTVSGIVLGLALGAYNAYRFLRERL